MQVQVKTNVLAKNDAIAESLQQLFKEKNIFVFNLLGSPGAGKTSLLEATLHDLKKDYRLAVIEGDLFTAKDAERIHELGVPVIQINTVGGCHLDAQMIQDALGDLNLDELDMICKESLQVPLETYVDRKTMDLNDAYDLIRTAIAKSGGLS